MIKDAVILIIVITYRSWYWYVRVRPFVCTGFFKRRIVWSSMLILGVWGNAPRQIWKLCALGLNLGVLSKNFVFQNSTLATETMYQIDKKCSFLPLQLLEILSMFYSDSKTTIKTRPFIWKFLIVVITANRFFVMCLLNKRLTYCVVSNLNREFKYLVISFFLL